MWSRKTTVLRLDQSAGTVRGSLYASMRDCGNVIDVLIWLSLWPTLGAKSTGVGSVEIAGVARAGAGDGEVWVK
jgi:hypothetical protein